MWVASLRERSSARATSDPVNSGYLAKRRATSRSSTARRVGSSTRQPVVCGGVSGASSPCQGRRTSPWPKSSAPKLPLTPTYRTSSPWSTSKPTPPGVLSVRSPLQRPRGIRTTAAMHSSIALSLSATGIASARLTSSCRTWQTVAAACRLWVTQQHKLPELFEGLNPPQAQTTGPHNRSALWPSGR